MMEELGDNYVRAVPFVEMYMGENRSLEQINSEEN